jgi:hypothetical protein
MVHAHSLLVRSVLFIACLGLSYVGFGQSTASRINVGVNLATLYSGLPEFQGDLFLNRYVGAVVSGGYTLYPRRSFYKIDDGVDLHSLKGAYWKLGLKGRFIFNKHNAPIPWLQLLYVGSQYEETGIVETTFTSSELKHISGTVHGFAVGGGFDFPMGKHLDFRLGLQVGSVKRAEHLGTRGMSWQPGFGPTVDDNSHIQFILGLNYRIGSVPKTKGASSPDQAPQ